MCNRAKLGIPKCKLSSQLTTISPPCVCDNLMAIARPCSRHSSHFGCALNTYRSGCRLHTDPKQGPHPCASGHVSHVRITCSSTAAQIIRCATYIKAHMFKSTSSKLRFPLEFRASAFGDVPHTTFHLHNRRDDGQHGDEHTTGACTVMLGGDAWRMTVGVVPPISESKSRCSSN
jgi:hypothetical protein